MCMARGSYSAGSRLQLIQPAQLMSEQPFTSHHVLCLCSSCSRSDRRLFSSFRDWHSSFSIRHSSFNRSTSPDGTGRSEIPLVILKFFFFFRWNHCKRTYKLVKTASLPQNPLSCPGMTSSVQSPSPYDLTSLKSYTHTHIHTPPLALLNKDTQIIY